MKSLATLKRMNSAIYEARNAYRKAVADNLIETGELRVISDDYDEDSGYPEGVLLSVPNRHFDLVDCVYDRIKASDKGIEVHICYFDDGAEDSWQWATELNFDDLDCIIDAIQWPDSIEQGEDEGEDLYLFFEESLCDYELIGRHIAVYDSEEQVQQVFNEAVERERKQTAENEWETGCDSKDCYEAYPEGYWGTSHTTIEWHKVKKNSRTTCYL